jgi:tRNA-splicing ligase RtcB (3'-phosphate/5'-hydroxy nucleic acid ligase)
MTCPDKSLKAGRATGQCPEVVSVAAQGDLASVAAMVASPSPKDVNALLRQKGYHMSHPKQFGAMARLANGLAKQGYGADAILAQIARDFVQEKDPYRDTPVPYKVWGAHLIQPGAIRQMEAALQIPVAVRGALMPDAHQGYALPVGGVIALRKAVSPKFVGPDIACRMMLTDTGIDPSHLTRNDYLAMFEFMKQASRFGAMGQFDTPQEADVMSDPLWRENQLAKGLYERALWQLGTSGSGNHFFNLMELVDGTRSLALVTHFGSRGLGYKVASHFEKKAKQHTDTVASGIPTGLEWLDLNSEEGQEYWTMMQLAGRYASAGHEIVHRNFLALAGMGAASVVENHHNFAWKEMHGGEEVIVHRKGATPAGAGVMGIIPGSVATLSYVVEGKGNPESLGSAPHGSGRVSSRTDAAKRHDPNESAAQFDRVGLIGATQSPDENYLAYKDSADVIDASQPLVTVKGVLHPRLSLMDTSESEAE